MKSGGGFSSSTFISVALDVLGAGVVGVVGVVPFVAVFGGGVVCLLKIINRFSPARKAGKVKRAISNFKSKLLHTTLQSIYWSPKIKTKAISISEP